MCHKATEKLEFITLLDGGIAPTKIVSLRTSPQTGVAISSDFRPNSADLMGIPTPVCALARNDSLLIYCPLNRNLKSKTAPIWVPLLLRYKGFLPVMVEDMMYSPTARFRPHFSSYSRDTGFSFTDTSTKPTDLIRFSNSSTEEAPLTQQECILGSFFSSSGICFIMTISQMEIRPPGFKTRKISR